MKLLALTRGYNWPSSRFRVRQYIPSLGELSIFVTEAFPRISSDFLFAGLEHYIRRRYLLPIGLVQTTINIFGRIPDVISSKDYDATLIQKSVVPGFEAIVKQIKRPRILDVDDAIWLEGLSGYWTPYLARNVDLIVAGNSFLADYFSKYCSNVRIVPTGIDVERFSQTLLNKDRPFTIGWTGTSGNFKYLQLIQNALIKFMKKNLDTRLLIIADIDPRESLNLNDNRVIFRQWTSESEPEVLHEMDVGIMPLESTDWARGKCSFKMLQYMSAGLPVIVSPVGMNTEILNLGEIGFGPMNDDEWIDSFQYLYENRQVGRKMGDLGRSIVVNNFSIQKISSNLQDIFVKISERS